MDSPKTEPHDFEGVDLLSDDLKAIRTVAMNVRNDLKQHRDQYKEQGFSLPSGITTSLNDIVKKLEVMGHRLETLEHERDQYRALADVAALINSSLDLTQVLNEVMDTIIGLTGAERGYLMLRNEETGEMEFRIARNVEKQTIDSSAFEISRNVVGRVAEAGEAVLTTNAQEDQRFKNAESIVSFSLRSILAVPLILKGEVTGVVYTDNKVRSGLFSEATLELTRAFANQAAVAIDNARLFARVKASLDAITEMKGLQDDIFASIASGVITADEGQTITLINRRAQQILNLHNDEIGLLSEVLPIRDPRLNRIIGEVRNSGHHLTNVEFDAEVAERGIVNLSLNISPLKDAYDQTRGVTIVVDDMTEAKRREAQIAGVRRYLPDEVVDGIQNAEELKLGGTRQVISILFADIRGFSTFSEQLGPEKLVEIVNAYMTIASDAIHAYQGVIDKFMGDAVMALYNTPLRPQADHALRAARTAMWMLQEVQEYHKFVGERDRLEFGIGLHTGEAIVGNVGSPERLDYTAMGDSVNLAKRLQEVAGPSKVLISDDTYQLIADYAEVKELEPVQVKGRKQFTNVYELLGIAW